MALQGSTPKICIEYFLYHSVQTRYVFVCLYLHQFWCVSCTVVVLTGFVMCGCVYVWVCVCVGFVICGCVYVWVCVCVDFVLCGCVYVWVL